MKILFAFETSTSVALAVCLSVVGVGCPASGDEAGADEASDTGETEMETDDGEAEQLYLDLADDFIAQLCAHALACECDEPSFESAQACAAYFEDDLHAQALAAYAAGLQWDEACATTRLNALESTCGRIDRGPCGAQYCGLFVGTVGEGGTCLDFPNAAVIMSDCEAGFGCYAGACYPICSDAPVQGCTEPFGATCPEGTGCAGDIGVSCQAQSGEGEDCSHFGPPCAPGLFCGGELIDLVCLPPAELGESCATVPCASGYCEEQSLACAEHEPLGSPCTQGWSCESGACIANVCAPRSGLGEPCDTHGACEEGLTCDYEADECVPRPVVCEPFF